MFRLSAHHYGFRALESVYFPPGKAGNVLRGAFGQWCDFERNTAAGPSGLAEPPAPFVLRAAHLDGRVFQAGETFAFDIHVFNPLGALPEKFEKAFTEWASTGLGPRRGRVQLIRPVMCTPVALDLSVASLPSTTTQAPQRITVQFRTPTELKGGPSPGAAPFGILMARIRDRISTLRSLYGEGPLPIDFKALSRRADLVGTVKCDLQYQHVSRRSSRTGAVHGIGGVTGTVEYEGNLAEFLPYLRAAWWTGVGRHTVWGNGVIEVAVCE